MGLPLVSSAQLWRGLEEGVGFVLAWCRSCPPAGHRQPLLQCFRVVCAAGLRLSAVGFHFSVAFDHFSLVVQQEAQKFSAGFGALPCCPLLFCPKCLHPLRVADTGWAQVVPSAAADPGGPAPCMAPAGFAQLCSLTPGSCGSPAAAAVCMPAGGSAGAALGLSTKWGLPECSRSLQQALQSPPGSCRDGSPRGEAAAGTAALVPAALAVAAQAWLGSAAASGVWGSDGSLGSGLGPVLLTVFISDTGRG